MKARLLAALKACGISPVLPIAITLIAVALVRPWGNFPINDDWQYAHIAEVFAQTNAITIDRPIAPALVVQTLLGGTLIKLVGMSHIALRTMTLCLWLLALILVDLMLRHATLGPWRRAIVLLLLALNPLIFVNSLSFMTEVYGTLPALAAAYVWMRAPDRTAPSIGRAVAAAVLASLAYLTRQFSGLILVALLLASFLSLVADGERRLRALVPHIVSGLIFVAVCATHWIWNRASQNETAQLAGPLSTLLQPKGFAIATLGGVSILYLTGFVAPLLVLLPIGNARRLVLPTILMACGAAAFYLGYQHFHERYPQSHFTFDKEMPYLTNVIGKGGIGPFTTIDLYLQRSTKAPYLPPAVWKYTARALFVLTLLWPIAYYAFAEVRRTNWRRWYLALIGLSFAALTLLASLQTYGMDLFDRYLYSVFVGLVIALGALLPDELRVRGLRVPLALVLLTPLVVFTVGGTHDYFQWQKNRALLYRNLLERNISPLSIDAGYELNGWYAFDGWVHNEPSPSCVSTCKPEPGSWYVRDNSYRISSTPKPHEITLERVATRPWLAKHPPIMATRRPDP